MQFRKNDELLPVIPKLDKLSDVAGTSTRMKGVVLCRNSELLRFNQAGGKVSHPLIASTEHPGYLIASDAAWADLLWQPYGVLAPVVKASGGNVLTPETDYTLSDYGIKLAGGKTAATVELYARSTTSNTYALLGDTFYKGAGTNPMWNRAIVSFNGVSGDFSPAYAQGDWTQGINTPGVGYLTVIGATTKVTCTYAYVKATTKTFIASYPNWVGGHIGQWPDIFVGVYNYPGDQYEDKATGQQIDPGLMPKFRDPGTYQINFREGTVEFPEAIDTNAAGQAGEVRANYARFTGLANVTGQVLDAVAGTANKQYKASSETTFTISHGKRWAGRDDAYMPINVYVNGSMVPVITSAAS